MAKIDSKEIIGDVRFALASDLRMRYPETDGARGFSHSTEAYLARAMFGLDLQGRRADYYIAPGDGGGLILVEVGDLEADKWTALVAKDGEPVRVLNVSTDRSVILTHPRHTPFEGDLLSILRQRL